MAASIRGGGDTAGVTLVHVEPFHVQVWFVSATTKPLLTCNPP